MSYSVAYTLSYTLSYSAVLCRTLSYSIVLYRTLLYSVVLCRALCQSHESTLGSEHNIDESTEERYLNETWGVIYGQDGAKSKTTTARTTATTSLGHLLTRSSFYGAASHGAAPSRTSQWYSIDLGLIHFVILDLDPGPPAVFAGAQAAWAAADLAAADANRANVPWIVVTSHYPLYMGSLADLEHASAAWYVEREEAREVEREEKREEGREEERRPSPLWWVGCITYTTAWCII